MPWPDAFGIATRVWRRGTPSHMVGLHPSLDPMRCPLLAPICGATTSRRDADAPMMRRRLLPLAFGVGLLAFAGCSESTQPLLLTGEYAMVSYGGQVLPAETGVRVRANPATGTSTICRDTVRSASIVLQRAGAARWRWFGETACEQESGTQATSVDLQASYTTRASGEVILEVYQLVVGPTMPPPPVEPLVFALRREGADELVLDAPIAGAPVLALREVLASASAVPAEGAFRVVWRRTR